MKVTARRRCSARSRVRASTSRSGSRRGDPARVRHADRLRRCATSCAVTSRAPATPPRGTRGPPGRSGSRSPPRARAGATVTALADARRWTPSRWSRSPGRSRRRSSATTHSRRPTSPASRCPSPSTTLVKDANELPVTIREAFHIARTGRPGPVLVDILKDAVAGVHLELAELHRPARLSTNHQGQPQAGAFGRHVDHGVRAPGPVRGWRRDQGRGARGALKLANDGGSRSRRR